MNKFGDVNSISPKVIGPKTLNYAPIFEFLLPPISFREGAPKCLDLTYKAALFSMIWQSFTAIGGGGSGILPMNQFPQIFVLGQAPNFGTYIV